MATMSMATIFLSDLMAHPEQTNDPDALRT